MHGGARHPRSPPPAAPPPPGRPCPAQRWRCSRPYRRCVGVACCSGPDPYRGGSVIMVTVQPCCLAASGHNLRLPHREARPNWYPTSHPVPAAHFPSQEAPRRHAQPSVQVSHNLQAGTDPPTGLFVTQIAKMARNVKGKRTITNSCVEPLSLLHTTDRAGGRAPPVQSASQPASQPAASVSPRAPVASPAAARQPPPPLALAPHS